MLDFEPERLDLSLLGKTVESGRFVAKRLNFSNYPLDPNIPTDTDRLF